MRGNHFSYVTGIPSGAAEAIELTLASQCRPVDDGRTIGFSNNPFANLADINQRMPFVLRAAKQFDDLLHSDQRKQIGAFDSGYCPGWRRAMSLLQRMGWRRGVLALAVAALLTLAAIEFLSDEPEIALLIGEP